MENKTVSPISFTTYTVGANEENVTKLPNGEGNVTFLLLGNKSHVRKTVTALLLRTSWSLLLSVLFGFPLWCTKTAIGKTVYSQSIVKQVLHR